MKVLYDITVLGNAYRDRWQRTGVFRVVDEIARRLAQSNECDLSFCCAVNPQTFDDAASYIGEDRLLGKIPQFDNRVANWVSTKRREVGKYTKSHGTVRKLVRRLLCNGLQRLERLTPRMRKQDLEKFDIFHSPAFFLPSMLRGVKRVKGILTVYDLIPLSHPQLCRAGSREFMEEALASLLPDRWAICISEATKRDLCNYLPSLDPKHALVIPLAASDKFYPCRDLALQSSVRARYGIPVSPYFLSLCTLEPRKNIDHLIRCFGALINQGKIKDANLVLIGEKGWDYEAIFRTVEQSRIPQERIIFAGYVPDEDLAPLYSGALAFVYPSLYEGFGLPPLEAMKAGTPVITSNVSSLPEVVGEAGLMVAPKDLDSLCDAMLQVYDSPSLAKELSQKSIARAAEFSWDRCARETLATYRAVLTS